MAKINRMRNQLKAAAWAGVMCLLTGCATQEKYNAVGLDRDYSSSLRPAAAPAKAERDSRQPIVLADTSAPDPASKPAARVVIYTAGIRLTVQDVRQTLDSIRRFADQSGGYMQETDNGSITIRVPAAKFDATIEQIAKLGEVTERQIKANDITEELHDLNLRLDNAIQVRQRLVALLDKAQKMEDTLAIEKEMARLSESIETLKGKIRFYESQAAMSTIKVLVNSPLPQKDLVEQIPFAWVRELGDGLLSGRLVASAERGGFFKSGTSFELPPAYVRYFEDDDRTEAMSAEGVLIKLQRHDNYDGGALEFWQKLARRAMVDNRGLAVTDERDTKLKSGAKAHMITGTREIAGKPFGYTLVIASNDRRVFTFEAWGPAETFKKDQAALSRSIETLDISK